MTSETCTKFMKTSELYLRMTEQKRLASNQREITPLLFSEYQITAKAANSITIMRKIH